jgi:hypothetical protein
MDRSIAERGIGTVLNERQEMTKRNEMRLIYKYNGAVHVLYCWSPHAQRKINTPEATPIQ